MPADSRTNNNLNYMPMTSDDLTISFAKRLVRAYVDDDVRLIGTISAENAQSLNDLDVINKIIEDIPDMSPDIRARFCVAFVLDRNNPERRSDGELDLTNVPPRILADAYTEFIARGDTDMANKMVGHIDDMIAGFMNSGGMIDGEKLVNTNNIADLYDGYSKLFTARMATLDENNPDDARYMTRIRAEQERIDGIVAEFDAHWGLDSVDGKNIREIEARYDSLMDALNRAELTEGQKQLVSKYKFLDADGNVIPQFIDENGAPIADYVTGARIDKAGRLATVVDLTRHDIAKRMAATDQEIDENQLEIELNEQVPFKLYEIDTADKLVNAAIDNPDAFMDANSRDAFVAELANTGGRVSDVGYNAALDAHANATGGWGARLKSKLAGVKKGGLWAKVFAPLRRVDRLANVRVTGAAVDKRQKRIEYFTRILKGFASAFVASALITTIATAAAALAGVSVAMSVAAIGVMLAIGLGVAQVMRWRRAQRDAGLPTDIHAFLADKRLVTSLGVSAIAVAAMCFGAAGMATAAMSLG